MIIRRLSLTNWMPFRGEHALDLPAGAVAVVGEHDGNQGRSNWSGKTAGAIESVLYALWGWHRKRLVDDVVTWGERECAVEVEFDDGFAVTRARGTAGAAVCTSTGLKGKDAEDGIAAVLRLSRDDAFASCVIRQGDMTRFVDATSAERQAIVADWLDQAAWERCEARAREEAREADAKANGLAQAVAALRQQLGVPVQSIDWEARAAVTRSELEQARGLLDAAKVTEEFELLRGRATELRARIAQPPPAAPSLQEQADADQALHHLVEELREAKRKRDWDGSCPLVDGLACPAREAVLTRLPVLKDRDAVIARLMRERDAVMRSQSEIEARLVAVRQDEGRRLAMQEELAGAIARGRELRAKLPAKTPDRADRQRAVQLITDLTRRLDVEVREEAAASALASARSRQEADVIRLTRERDEQIARADALWGAAEAFGRNGVQAAEAEGALADLEERGNRILQGTGLDFAFATAREGQKLESACRRCRHTYRGQKDRECPACRTKRERQRADVLDLLVSADGGPRQDVAECSGGARALVGAAVRLAAASLLRSTRGSPFSVLLVDEPFASLDEEHRRLLARRLGEMAAIAGFEQMLVVTHDRDLADSLPARLVVKRSGGYSTIEVEV